MRKRLLLLPLLLILCFLTAIPVLAQYIYRATYTISENGTASYTMLPVWEASNNQFMIDNGFILDADALDTRIETLGGLVRPHLITDNMTLTAVAVPTNSQTNLYFTTGNSLLSAFDIIVGRDGDILTLDHNDIELGDNWTVEEQGWVDTTSVNSSIVEKPFAFRTYISDTGNITSDIIGSASVVYEGSNDIDRAVWGVNWAAQSFTTPAYVVVVTTIEIYAEIDGVPGDVTASIRASAGDKPTGVDLTSGITGTAGWGTDWHEVDVTDYALAPSAPYALVLRAPGGGAGNELEWYADNTGPTAPGKASSSPDSGGTWNLQAYDMNFRIYGYAVVDSVTADGFSSQEYIVTTTANVTHFWIEIDRNVEDITALTANVTNNSENWTWMQGNSMPYADNITVSVNGTERLRYKPATYIRGDNLPDLTGATQNGTFTWGTNPTGVIVSLGSMVSSAQPAPGVSISRPAQDILPEVEVSDWFVEPDISGTLLTNPIRPFVTILSDSTDLTERQAWIWLALAFILLVTVATARVVRGHHLITGIAGGASLGAMVALTIFPLWTLVFMILFVFTGIVAERSPSL